VRREDHLALLLVEQHARIALEFAENAIILDRGAIVFAARAATSSTPPIALNR